MKPVDWAILGVSLAGLGVFSIYTSRLMKGVADFLAANRQAGRYLLTVAGGMAGMGAITAVAFFEMYYAAGFVPVWWQLMSLPVGVIITLSGWVYYRYRETRAMTMAQFFEMRYSRAFRIYAGILAWLSGILNFGIFPVVEARFFVYYCDLPRTLQIPVFGTDFEILTVAVVMFITLGISVIFALLGGQITVMATDCAQGIYCLFAYLFIAIFLITAFSWSDITHALKVAPTRLVQEEAEKKAAKASREAEETLRKAAEEAGALEARAASVGSAAAERLRARARALRERAERRAAELRSQAEAAAKKAQDPEAIKAEANRRSLLNPYRTSGVRDFNLWFFLISMFLMVYGYMAWQGRAGYLVSGRNPHEQKMGAIIANWFGLLNAVIILLVPIIALTVMNLPKYAEHAEAAKKALSVIPSETLQTQMRVPVVISRVLPAGVKGLFATVMLFFLITTQDTYIHSWGSIFVQDVILPFRKKPFTPKQQLTLLRLSILFVAVFAFVFGLTFKMTEYIMMFMVATGAIVAGMGACIVGGLYWKRGTPAGALAAMTVGWVLAVSRLSLQQVGEAMKDVVPRGTFLRFLDTINGINSMVIRFWIVVVCLASYIVVSLLTKNEEGFSMDRVLHRGKYAIEGEHVVAKDRTRSLVARIVGITEEFSFTDRLLAYALVIWQFGWFAVFILGTVYNLTVGMSDDAWARFWRFWLILQIAIGIPATIWFTIGGIRDLRRLFVSLKTIKRDERDDGRVVHHHLATETDAPAARDDGNS